MNERPSHIDRIFADGRLIDEALAEARANAIERHRRAGVPMVVYKDARIEHVPADRLTPDVDALLKDADFAAERSATELIAWYEERRSAIRSCQLARKPAALHQGRFKKLFEELYPFVLWLKHCYPRRSDVYGSLNPDANPHRDYDAIVKDCATDPPTVTYVQLTTTAFDLNELLQRKEALTAGAVVDRIAFTQADRLQRLFERIDGAIQNKKSRGFSFGPAHVLVVDFDDFKWFGMDEESDCAALRSFVRRHMDGWRLPGKSLDIVGLSGRTFLSFPTSAG